MLPMPHILSPAHVIQVNLRVVSKTTLVWPTTVVVLHAISIEDLHLPIVHLHGAQDTHHRLHVRSMELKWCQGQADLGATPQASPA